MKKYFALLYWGVMVVAMSLMFMSIMGSFGAAFFLSVMLLPGVLFVKFFSKDISFKNRRKGIENAVYFVAIVMLIEYLGIIFVYWSLYKYPDEEAIPDIVLNPVFIFFILGALLSIEYLLRAKLFTAQPAAEKYISFISERKKVSLELDTVIYIESRDYEVMVVTATGTAYPTRMKISQWESALDDRFVRIHRSFIVNRNHITQFDSRAVRLGETVMEISRKYRESVMDKLEKAST